MTESKPRRKYAEASRRPGELSVSEVADRLGLNVKTVRRYAGDAAAAAPTRLPEARRDILGRLWVPERALDGFVVVDPDAAPDCW